jgi:hypothetical protein
MGYDLTLSGLLRKRAEMAGQVETMQAQLGALIADLTHIDAAIRVFRPDIDLADLPEKLAPAPFTGFRGEIQRFLLDELRGANYPLRHVRPSRSRHAEARAGPIGLGGSEVTSTAHRLCAGEAAEQGQGDERAGAPECALAMALRRALFLIRSVEQP